MCEFISGLSPANPPTVPCGSSSSGSEASKPLCKASGYKTTATSKKGFDDEGILLYIIVNAE